MHRAVSERSSWMHRPEALHKATRWAMGWIRITYYLDGDDEEHEHASFAGPES